MPKPHRSQQHVWLPNKRLKLAAPVLTSSGDASTFGVVEFRL